MELRKKTGFGEIRAVFLGSHGAKSPEGPLFVHKHVENINDTLIAVRLPVFALYRFWHDSLSMRMLLSFEVCFGQISSNNNVQLRNYIIKLYMLA